MTRQLNSRARADSLANAHARPGRPLLLAAVCLFLIAAPVAEGQGQPAKQEPKVGRVKMLDTLKGHKHPLFFVAFINGGKTLVSSDWNDYKVGIEAKLWDVAARKNT